MKIGVILPSRGLVFSRTMEELLRELESYNYEIFWSHDKPIPECFNYATDEALNSNPTHLWFVEEDMHLPEGILGELLDVDEDIVTADYPVAPGVLSVAYRDDKVMYCGTGCLLIKRGVLKYLKPYFRSNTLYSYPDFKPRESNKKTYGKHDVDFGVRVNQLGYEIKVIETKAGQYRIKEMGEGKTNEGFHTVGLL